MAISFIIVSYKSSELLSNAILSIEKFNDTGSFEVIVVDNNSDNINFSEIKKISKNLKIFQLDKNHGFGYANNYGVAKAKYNNICLLNLDAELLSSTSQMINIIDKNKNTLIGGEMVNKDNIVTSSFGKFPSNLLRMIFPGRMYYREQFKDAMFFEVDWIEASFLLFKKEVWGKMGGFDENIFMYGEDILLCYEAKLKGVKRYVSRQIKYYHKGGYNPSRDKDIYKGILYFLSKTKKYPVYIWYKTVLTFSLVIKILCFSPTTPFNPKTKLKCKSLISFLKEVIL